MSSQIDQAIKLSAEYLTAKRNLSKFEIILLIKALLEEVIKP